jgi:hypothetical protein
MDTAFLAFFVLVEKQLICQILRVQEKMHEIFLQVISITWPKVVFPFCFNEILSEEPRRQYVIYYQNVCKYLLICGKKIHRYLVEKLFVGPVHPSVVYQKFAS